MASGRLLPLKKKRFLILILKQAPRGLTKQAASNKMLSSRALSSLQKKEKTNRKRSQRPALEQQVPCQSRTRCHGVVLRSTAEFLCCSITSPHGELGTKVHPWPAQGHHLWWHQGRAGAPAVLPQ